MRMLNHGCYSSPSKGVGFDDVGICWLVDKVLIAKLWQLRDEKTLIQFYLRTDEALTTKPVSKFQKILSKFNSYMITKKMNVCQSDAKSFINHTAPLATLEGTHIVDFFLHKQTPT